MRKISEALKAFFNNSFVRWIAGIIGVPSGAILLILFSPLEDIIKDYYINGGITVSADEQTKNDLDSLKFDIVMKPRDEKKKDIWIKLNETKRAAPGDYKPMLKPGEGSHYEDILPGLYNFLSNNELLSFISVKRREDKTIRLKLLRKGKIHLTFSNIEKPGNYSLVFFKTSQEDTIKSLELQDIQQGAFLDQGVYTARLYNRKNPDTPYVVRRNIVVDFNREKSEEICCVTIYGKLISNRRNLQGLEIVINNCRIPVDRKGEFLINGLQWSIAYSYKILKSGTVIALGRIVSPDDETVINYSIDIPEYSL